MTKPTQSGDILIKAISKDKNLVLVACDATHTLSESLKRTHALPTSMMHLGRGMLAAALFQSLGDSDDPQRVELHWSCQGPFGDLYCEARKLGALRGTLGNFFPESVHDFKQNLGKGLFQVRKSLMQHPDLPASTGIVNAEGDVGLDIVSYLEQSEQKHCGIQLWVHLKNSDDPDEPFIVADALAYMIHVLPQDSEEKMHRQLQIWDSHMQNLGPISHWELPTEQNERVLTMLRFLTGEKDPQILEKWPLRFECTCNTERAERALALVNAPLAKGESPEAISGSHSIRCEFCGHRYLIEGGSTRSQ